MASLASSSNLSQLSLRLRRSLMAGMALVQADVAALTKSWVVRIWLLVLLMSFLVVPVAVLVSGGPGSTPASSALAAYLAVFLNVWSIVIIVLSAGSVSLESEIVADSILSRACTRTQYILAKLTSRALVIGGVYLVAASAAAYVSWRYGAVDVTLGTMVSGIAIVGLALLMLVSLGVTMSAIFNNTIISIIGLLLLWHVAGTVFAFAGAEYMSPASLTGRLPEILRDSEAPQVVSCSATSTSVSIIFSKDVDRDSAEQLDNYTVEDPDGDRHVPQTAVYDSAAATVRLSGLDPEVTEAVTVTVDGVTDGAGNEVSPGANEATSRPPPVESEDDEEADPEDEASPDSSEEDSDDDPNEDEGDDGARAAVYRPATPTVVMTGFSLPRITPAAVVAERETDDPGDTVSQEPDEAPPGPIPPEDEDEPEADRDAEGVTPAPESTPEETTPAESEDEPEADPVTESPAPLPEAIPEADAAEEEVTPTPEPAAPQPPGPPANRPGEGVTGGARGVVGPTPYPAFAPPMPAASAAGPMSEASAPPPLATPAPNPNAAGRAPTPEPAAAESDAAAGDPTDRPPRVTQVKATRATVSVTFSQDMDPVEVEALENYTVESPPGTTRLATTTAYDPDQKTVLLSGLSFDPGDPVRVTVSDMSNRGGTEIDPRHNSATFSEVQTWKFLVGFGVPALLFALVGVVWFSWRDL